MILTVKGFSVVKEAEIDVFLKFSCFFYDQMDVGNLISGSCAFSKSSLYVWKFSVHILLKCSLKDFWALPCWLVKWVQFCGSLNIPWHCPSLGLEWKLTFPVLWPLLRFPNLWYIECSILIASSFRIWNSSVGIPSLPLALFIVMLPKAPLDFTLQDVWL